MSAVAGVVVDAAANTPWTLRALAAADVPGLLAVQRACYGEEFVEAAEVFVRRLASPANCSLVLTTAQGEVCAYLAAYRSRLGCITPLHGDFEATAQPDTLYLHDLAVAPAWAGRGLAVRLLAPAWAQARRVGLTHSALVAVQGAQHWWQRHGYAPRPQLPALQQAHLSSYGAAAVYLYKSLL